MPHPVTIDDIKFRTELRAGDLGYITYIHGVLYRQENDYGLLFEAFVAEGLVEFFRKYDPEKERVWFCEYNGETVGFMALVNRGDAAQLRFVVLKPEFRGIGLGNKMLELFFDAVHAIGYGKAYLWTTNELPASAHLYRKFGFRLAEEHVSASWGKPVVEQRYEVEVKEPEDFPHKQRI